MAAKSVERDKPLYQVYRLFEVEESSPAAGGETALHSLDDVSVATSVAIEHCCYQETANYSLLALVCNNGYIIFRLQPFLCQPIIKQLKWFEDRSHHILGVTLDPLGEWLACACLDGRVYLIPALALLMPNCSPSHKYGSLDDLTVAHPISKVAPPTAIVWWEGMDGSQVCITGSELGEITFFDLHELKQIASIGLRGCIDQLLLAQHTDNMTHLLINLRGGEWWWLLLEERYHEAVGASYSDVQASGFEVVYDDAVLRSILIRPDMTGFEPKLFHEFTEFNKLSLEEWNGVHMLGSVNLSDSRFELYSYNFDCNSRPIRSIKLFNGVTQVHSTERILFTISHNDDCDDQLFTLSVISRELAQRGLMESSTATSAILQQFNLPSHYAIIGFFTTKLESPPLAAESRELTTPTNLGGCLIVTATAVYQCRQLCSPESVFLDHALSNDAHHLTDDIAITYRLDICGLYKAAADYKLARGEYGPALELYQQAKTPASDVIQCFISRERVPELLNYIQNIVYNESSDAATTSSISSSAKPNILQNILLKCYIHQCLEGYGAPVQNSLTQFIHDKFLYDHKVAMDLLIQSGLLEPLLELAKTHHKVPDTLELLLANGRSSLPSALENIIANKQFAEHLVTVGSGMIFHQLSPFNVAKCVIAQPSILEYCLLHLLSVIGQLNISVLTQLASVLDPSHSTIQPLLQHAHSNLKRSSSTGSITSMLSTESTGTSSGLGLSLSSYIEAFLYTLIVLQYKRERKPLTVTGLLSISPLLNRLGITPAELVIRPLASFADGTQLLNTNTLSCGVTHGALVVNGQLYTWGNTKQGKLGHGDIELAPIAAPLRVETFSMLSAHVVSVSCGADHTVALCQEGVYSWGSSTHGQLGHGDTLKRSRPVQVAALADISLLSIECGHYHCLALDDNHGVWVWGWGVHGQLGLGSCDDVLVPTHARSMDDLIVSYIAAGFNHSAVISHEGKLYTFGNGMYGQLGHGNQEKQATPTLVYALTDKVVYLVGCGTSHTVAVCADQAVYQWGKNLHKPHPGHSPQSLRQYTRSRREGASSPAVANSLNPLIVPGLDSLVDNNDIVVQVECGNSHCLLLLLSGVVLSWGSNTHGQIGHTHVPELSQPKQISKLEDHNLLILSAGDEFTIGVDDGGITWVWGRDDLGQLGMEFSGVREGKKVCIFAPNPNPQVPTISLTISKTNSPEVQQDNELLRMDLGWALPDFANYGSLGSYGRETLSSAVHYLHGYYRPCQVIHYCEQYKDYKTMVDIYSEERQWKQSLYWSLYNLSFNNEVSLTKCLSIVENCLSNLTADSADILHSRDYIITTSDLLHQVLEFWNENKLNVIQLELLLMNFLPSLAYPLSLLFKRDEDCQCFSFKFTIEVTMQLMAIITGSGGPLIDDILISHSSADSKLPIETSPNDSRLWSAVLRNLFKDSSRHESLSFSESQLVYNNDGTARGVVAFSCSHSFSEVEFQRKILSEFRERLNDLPHQLILTTPFLLQYYKQCYSFTSACPYCLFQHLRRTQLQNYSGVPIKPWNPLN